MVWLDPGLNPVLPGHWRNRLIALVGRVFTNGLGNLGSIPGCVIPKTLKMVLDVSLLNTQQYKVSIKGKEEQSLGNEKPPPTPWYSSYWKGSLQVTPDYGRQLYFFYTTGGGPFLSLSNYSSKQLLLILIIRSNLSIIPIWYKKKLSRSFWFINGTLTGTPTLGRSGPGSNSYERTFYSPQNCSLTIRCSLVSYPRQPFSVSPSRRHKYIFVKKRIWFLYLMAYQYLWVI